MTGMHWMRSNIRGVLSLVDVMLFLERCRCNQWGLLQCPFHDMD